ncbi:SRPBCC domain-containing protein [Enhygromyxa salina]|uniref:Polyketide cyclase / dehydrase and lipid transport n=1 Tax=Enhygromyxa salina TaxID=215803 RepID=A0A2S9YSJ1_9BACT|nr:SRPBCC domain-containing protein [Enhygromyxa salina]PRQ08053.1 Polyketide cyclase / dehydrase and lipid transport [Enhygromyxa salina]
MAKLFATRVEITASADRVWAILEDLDAYPDWNPFTPRIETSFVVGEPIVLHVSFDGAKPRRQVEILRRWAPGQELRWGMTIGPAWFFRAERIQRVEVLGDQRSRYVSEDAFAGLLSPIVELLFGGKVQRGFDRLGAALKRRAEAG